MLNRNNIIEIVLVLVVTANGQNKLPAGVSKRSTSDIVDSIRHQLMENNYDYAQSRESPAPAEAARVRAGNPQPTLRRHTNKRKPVTKRRIPIELLSRSPPANYHDIYHRPPPTPPTPPQRFKDEQLHHQHELRSDFEELLLHNQPTHSYSTTKPLIYQQQPSKQYRSSVNTDAPTEHEIQTQTSNYKYPRKKPSVVHRLPYPKIELQYSPTATPQGAEHNSRPSSNKQLKHSQRYVEYKPHRSRIKLTSHTRDPVRHVLQEHINIQRNINRNIHAPSSTHKSTSNRVVPHWSSSTIPESLWEEDRGPFEPEQSHSTLPGADEPLAKMYHFRAEDDLPDTHNDSAVHISFIKLRKKSGNRRSGSFRRVIMEQSPDGISLLSLDNEPLPEFRLPASYRQYMDGSRSHENLHELH